jgi:hypothetical protein
MQNREHVPVDRNIGISRALSFELGDGPVVESNVFVGALFAGDRTVPFSGDTRDR